MRIHSGSGEDTSIDLFWTQSEAIWRSGVTARLLDSQDKVMDTVAVP
ncbi:MAG: hypothetical protein HC802_15545 [Caldilineaceae bacterium]|nr:hypothetical protein [Caldilineaceae bacterium]